MTETHDMIDVDELETLLHQLHGHYLLAMRDHLPEETKDAVHVRGIIRGYQDVIRSLETYRDEGDLPDSNCNGLEEEFETVSRAVFDADMRHLEAARERQYQTEPDTSFR